MVGTVWLWLLVGLAAATLAWLAYRYILRPWVLRWGATAEEARQYLPGDELVPRPHVTHTHAVTIDAPAQAIWPWLVQMGQSRGGLYSYDWLENLLGMDIHSADRIVPELQGLQVGDMVSLRRGNVPAFLVHAIEPGRALVLRARAPRTGRPATLQDPSPLAAETTWAFVLIPKGDGSTRLLVRQRVAHKGNLLAGAMWELVELASFVMERRMLLGVRQRAQRARVLAG